MFSSPGGTLSLAWIHTLHSDAMVHLSARTSPWGDLSAPETCKPTVPSSLLSPQIFSAKQFYCLRPFSLASLQCSRKRGIATVCAATRVHAAKGGGSRKLNGTGKPITGKKGSPWRDDSTVSTISGNLGRKPSGGGRRESSAKGSIRERKTEDSRRASDGDANVEKRTTLTSSLVSAAMPVETEVVLQAQEPSTTPSWKTFASSLCGVWRGVGAAFSPITAEMEPIALGDENEMLYDSRICSTVEEVQGTSGNDIHRKTIWAVGNPYGEQGKEGFEVQNELAHEGTYDEGGVIKKDRNDEGSHDTLDNILLSDNVGIEVLSSEPPFASKDLAGKQERKITSDLDSKDLSYDTMMEEDVMDMEPGLIFFEDGSYSRGPLRLFTGHTGLSNVASPTYKIEQSLVRGGGHTRLRLVHTLSVEEEGEAIQLLRLAVYEEEWVGPSSVKSISETGGHDIKLFSQRKRPLPKELVGSWKVFELSATCILPEESVAEASNERPPYVYLSMETLKQRLLPEVSVHFIDEDILDMQDATVMWIPGGVTAYLDIKQDGLLTIGVGWYKDGVNLVMERDYNSNGNLYEVRTKSEVKGGWAGGRM